MFHLHVHYEKGKAPKYICDGIKICKYDHFEVAEISSNDFSELNHIARQLLSRISVFVIHVAYIDYVSDDGKVTTFRAHIIDGLLMWKV